MGLFCTSSFGLEGSLRRVCPDIPWFLRSAMRSTVGVAAVYLIGMRRLRYCVPNAD